MVLCIATFVGTFLFAAGIYLMAALPGLMSVTYFDGLAPLPMVVMLIGFLVALISFLMVRSMGDTFSEDEKTVHTAFRASLWLALLASVGMCAIQLYMRFDFSSFGFFANAGDVKEYVSVNGLDGSVGVLALFSAALSVFLGLPWYIVCYFGGDFSRYVTVTRTYLSDGSSYESGRSESYVSIGLFLFLSLLLTVPFLALNDSVVTYLVAAFYATFIFGARSKKRLAIFAAIFGAAALALVLLSLLSGL